MVEQLLNYLLIGVQGLIGLTVLVVIHELGHFLVAKRNGVWVEEFGVGLPPKVWGKKIGATLYSINAIPLGGFVRLHGEVSQEVEKPKMAFANKSIFSRAKIIMAGIVMNFLFGILTFAIYFSFTGFTRETGEVKILEVATNSPAQVAGIVVGDRIIRADKKDITTDAEFIQLATDQKGQKINVELLRDGEVKKVTLTPRQEPPEGEGPVGIALSSKEVYWPPVWQRPFLGMYYGTIEAVELGRDIVFALGGIAQDVSRGEVPKGLVAPTGILATIAYFVRQGALPALKFLGLLSVNLAILNLVPFPPLDGSRLVFLGIEGVTRKKVSAKLEGTIHTIGMVVLLLVMLLITAREVPKLFAAQSLEGFVESLFTP